MKLKSFSNHFLHLLILIAAITISSACNKDDDNPGNIVQFSATLDQAQETPPTGVSATGSCTATYDTATNQLTYTLTWTGLTGAPTAMHFHKADIGVPGDVEIPINDFPTTTSGTFSSSATVDQNDENDLLENKFYVNIHTAAYPAGEIRGQLIKQ